MKQAKLAFLAFAAVIGTTACTINVPPQNTQNYQHESQHENSSSSTLASFGDVKSACDRIQESNEVPIACKITDFDNKTTMVVAFPSKDMYAALWSTIGDNLGKPFCEATDGGMILAMTKRQGSSSAQAKAYSCAADVWSDWKAIDLDL
jgi:hypothetical protein